MSELTELTLNDASERLDNRSVSVVELVQATLDRIEQTEPIIHAYVHVLKEEALAAAKEADREIATNGRRGPLHGLPLAVKDNMHMKGVPTEAGSKLLAGFIAQEDATPVRLLREAGAIIIGKTVCHEFAYGVNEPPTRSPWDSRCYPGGSSAGSAVSVSVRSAFGTLGSDTGGSIRIPAFTNGIVGLKPTYGRVSGYGVIPLAWSLDHVGPLTRTVTDCALIFQAIARVGAHAPASADQPVPDCTAGIEAGVHGLRIGVERDYFFYKGVSDDVRAAVEEVIVEYEQQGAIIVDVEIPEIAAATDLLNTILLVEASTYHQKYLRTQGDSYDPATRALLELGELIPATHYVTAQRGRAAIKKAMAALFHREALDALLAPTIPLTTTPLDELHIPRADYPAETPMQSYVHHTFAANIVGQPAINVPCGLSTDGLPIGFQLAGRPFDEAMLFRIGRAYERATEWTQLKPPLGN
jgi:aspartyl-tRNA(Asn)/glutamyl-tRNA(Gln) amidotransferase subunit A